MKADSSLGVISSVGLELMSSQCQELVFELSGALRVSSTQLLSDLRGPLLLQNPVVRKVPKWQFIPHQANCSFSQDLAYILEGLSRLKAENILSIEAGKHGQFL